MKQKQYKGAFSGAWARRDLLRGGLALSAVSMVTPALAQSSPEEAALEAKLKDMGITLPAAPRPFGNYLPAVLEGNLLFVAGMLPNQDGKLAYRGTVPTTISVENAAAAARLCAINILAAAKGALGSLARVKRVVRVEGFVASADDFIQQPTVMNGASEVFGGLWGEDGKHARFAIGVNVLPLGAPVEVAAVLAVK